MDLFGSADPAETTCRRLMNRRLTVQESRRRPARAIRHGKRGQVRRAYREVWEDWRAAPVRSSTPLCCGTPAAPGGPSRNGPPGTVGQNVKGEGVARFCPLGDRHIDVAGRRLSDIRAGGPGQGLCPFRDPGAVEADADADDGGWRRPVSVA
ncbi:hypothetical protein ACWCQK_36305 [Streptomyces sp. NPDC002306]